MQAPHPAPESPQGIPLSRLLLNVTKTVADAYKTGVWTVVEIMRATTAHGTGHVYLELSERDSQGAVLAKTSATIWGAKARSILPSFERATGVSLAAGIKVLLRVRPVFKAQFGFSLDVEAIDAQFTLGDFELRKKEIREQLQLEELFSKNKELPKPWDFNSVLVLAPEGGAGLGDFQAEASRLSALGICQFLYCFSRFQGEGAPAEMRAALISALKEWKERAGTPPDAIVIIRGGGAVNDLAWLNDFALTRLVCRLPIPVLTGIGHEKDSTLLDEVANQSFDTPSKVIAGIERLILHRANQARQEYEFIVATAKKLAQSASHNIDRLDASFKSDAARHVEAAKRMTQSLNTSIVHNAEKQVDVARAKTELAFNVVKNSSVRAVSKAKAQLPSLMGEISLNAKHHAGLMRQRSHELMLSIEVGARTTIEQGRMKSEALVREITGQGPEKTLKRGFALVLADGKPVSRAAQVKSGAEIQLQFSDGTLQAHIDHEK